ncbi:hypothetical protein ACFSNO_30440 [Streptomyces cirratus]
MDQELAAHEEIYLLAALAVIFLDMLRYVDALQIYKMRMSMRNKIEAVTLARQAEQGLEEEERKVVFIEDLLRENPLGEADALKREKAEVDQAEVIDLHQQFRERFPWYARVRHALVQSRIRPHLISGIEFQMFIFIIGPVIGHVLWTTAVSAVLMGAFELVIMFKFWLSTRDFTRTMERLDPGNTPSRAGSIAPHLHAGRHRRRGEDDARAMRADQMFPAPEPYEDPGFQPYPRPYTDEYTGGVTDTMQLHKIPSQPSPRPDYAEPERHPR